jgi:hypothetical protein
MTPQSGENEPSADRPAIQRFLYEAAQILAREQGLTPKCQAMLEEIADHLGLSANEAQAAMERLRNPSAPPVSTPVAPPPAAGGASPLREPPRPGTSESPQAVFRTYVREALGKSSRDHVSERTERKLIEQGIQKLGLSEVLARQVVHQVALDLEKTVWSLERQRQEAAQADRSEEHPKRQQFLDRAAAILAEQRGINARSRVLLAAAAGELGLTDEQMEAAIAALTAQASRGASDETWQVERAEAFRSYLREVLPSLPYQVVTSQLEQKWVQEGEHRYGLEPPQARQTIRDVAGREGVRIVSEEQARGHVSALVDQLLGEGGQLDDATRARIYNEANQWGLTPPQVDAIVRDGMRTRRRRERARRSVTTLVLSGSFGTLLAVLLLLGWAIFVGQRNAARSPGAAVDERKPGDAAPSRPTIEAPTGTEWWARDEDLLVAVTQTRAILPELKPVLLGLELADPDTRARAQRQLVREAAAYAAIRSHRILLQELIAGCYAAEPSDLCSQAISEELLALLPAVGDELPRDEGGYEVAFWAVRTAAGVLARPGVPPSRADYLARGMGAAVGMTIDTSLAPLDLQHQCLAAFCRHLCRVIIRGCEATPLVARRLYEGVMREATNYLDHEVIERTNVDFLAAALPAAGESWREFEELIGRTVDSADSLVVLRLVELFEQVTEPSLQAYLAGRLLRRAGVFPQPISPAEVAKRVREALGAEQQVTGGQRRERFVRAAESRLDEELPAGEVVQAVLQQTVRLTHASTMACALAQGEVGHATFDELERDGPVDLKTGSRVDRAGAARRPRAAARPSSSSYENSLERYIQYLLNPRGRPAQRAVFLRGIASLAEYVPEVDLVSAERLASYLLRPKPEDERQAVAEHAEALGRWKNVRLAMADKVLETPLQQETAEELLAGIFQRQIALADDDWRQQAYALLLDDVIRELARDATSDVYAEAVYDDAREALRELYRTQARLLGVSPEKYATANTPSELLHLLAERAGPEVSGSGNASAARWPLSADLEAIAFVADNDLQTTVLLQRTWLHALSVKVAEAYDQRWPLAREIIDSLYESDAAADDLVAQLRDGERALLQMWLLMLPEG